MKKLIIICLFILSLPNNLWAYELNTDSQPEEIISPSIRILNSDTFEIIQEISPFDKSNSSQGLNIYSMDLNDDKYSELIVSSGPNSSPLVKIYNYLGEFQYDFLAYAETFKHGFKAIAADLFNDGSPEIITAPNEGGGPHIRVFDNLGFVYFSFFAFDKEFRGGANISVGDINNDQRQEIIVGAGYGMEPLVKIFSPYGNFISQFKAYNDNVTGGINVLAADVNNDQIAEIITAPTIDYKPLIRIFNQEGKLINEFYAYHPGFWGGVNLAQGDIDQDGTPEILTGAGFGGGAHIRFYNEAGQVKINPKLFVYENFKGGISIASDDINNDGQPELIAATQTISPFNKYQSHKLIEIDLSKQKLYTYLRGNLENEFWVSTGTWRFPTPTGKFYIQGKIPSVRMTGYYGPNHPDNYDLPNVPNVMPFYKDYAIHGAYWHFNFGTRVSHGCVNMRLDDAKFLYNWANVGTPVIIYSSK